MLLLCFNCIGDKYIGCWYRGEMHGQGVKSHLDGSILEG